MIVAVGYYVEQWSLPALPKYLALAIVSLAIAVALYDVVVRRDQRDQVPVRDEAPPAPGGRPGSAGLARPS